jgi:hypothetical protein
MGKEQNLSTDRQTATVVLKPATTKLLVKFNGIDDRKYAQLDCCIGHHMTRIMRAKMHRKLQRGIDPEE